MTHDTAAALRERGIQVTAQRLAVLRAVAGCPHITADAVAGVVRSEIGAISLQSVYDALGLLVGAGLLRRIQPSGSPARFEDRVGDNHHHLICRTCGQVLDVDCATGASPCLTASDGQGYEIDEAEVAYWGRCPACVAQSSSVPPDDPSRFGARRETTRSRPDASSAADGGTIPPSDRRRRPTTRVTSDGQR